MKQLTLIMFLVATVLALAGCEDKPVRQGREITGGNQNNFTIYDISDESTAYLEANYPKEEHAAIKESVREYLYQIHGKFDGEDPNGAAVQSYKNELLKVASMPKGEREKYYKEQFENPIYKRRKLEEKNKFEEYERMLDERRNNANN